MKRSRKIWTAEEIQIMQDRYPHELTKNIANDLGRPICSLYHQARKLGLNKTEEFRQSKEAQLFRKRTDIGKRYYFKKGHIPANKGKKMSQDLKHKVAHTFFQKGHVPENVKPIGTISIRKSPGRRAYKWIKVSIHKWEMLHRVMWNQQVGPIPKGFNVQFKDGDQMNCNIENLYLIDRKGNMLQNTINNYPDDIKKTIRVISSLNKVIKNATK